jgi:hypothetical protein
MAFNFPDGASNGQTHTASNGTVYRYNGTTWVVDSANTTSTFDSRYLNTNGDGILSGSVTDQLPSGVISGSSQITITESQISDLSHTTLPSGLVSGSSQLDGFVSSSSANIIEVITSASYAAITPVSGTLYIIQG